jgi:RNA polymerase sigma-70 factor, ECF subfamily
MVLTQAQGFLNMPTSIGSQATSFAVYSPAKTTTRTTGARQEMQTVNQEALWLDQARQGDKAAFGKLIEAYQGPVFNLAYRMLSDAREAEEAAQEAFIRAYTRLDSYNPAHKFSTWMLSITSNYCIDLIRKRRALLLSIDEPLPPHPALMSEKGSGPEGQAVQAEQEVLVQQLLQTLPEDYRETVILRYWYDMSYEEIADMMDTTVSAIKSRLFRARRDLAEAGLAMGLGGA